MRRRLAAYWVFAAIALMIAFALDATVATAVHHRGWDIKHDDTLSILRESIKLLGFFPTTIVLALFVAWLHNLHWRAAVFLLLASVPAALNELIKWIAGRLRPFKGPNMRADEWMTVPQPHTFHPFTHTKNLSFPSGHAALAFATATAFSILFPRGRAWWFLGAVIVGLERVTENAHWCSDVAAAAMLGIGGAKLVELFFRRHGLLTQPERHGFPI